MNKKHFILIVIGLILLRVIMVVLVMNNIPFTDMQLGGFRPHFGGQYWSDEDKFFDTAKEIIAGRATSAGSFNLGYGFFLAPFIYFTGAKTAIDIAKPIFVAQEFILFPIALILIILIALHLFNSLKPAIISGFLFVIYPWLLLGLGKVVGYKSAIPAFHHQLWIIIQSDYVSAVLVYLAIFLFLKYFNNLFVNSEIYWKKLILLSAVSGSAVLTRMSNIFIALIIFAVFLYFKRIKKALWFGLLSAAVYLPQLIYNWMAFGAPWIFGYYSKEYGYGKAVLNWAKISNLWLNFNQFSPENYFWVFALFALSISIMFILGFKYLRSCNNIRAVFASLWFWSQILFYGMFTYSSQSLRYFLPVIPFLIYFFVASIMYLQNKLKTQPCTMAKRFP